MLFSMCYTETTTNGVRSKTEHRRTTKHTKNQNSGFSQVKMNKNRKEKKERIRIKKIIKRYTGEDRRQLGEEIDKTDNTEG